MMRRPRAWALITIGLLASVAAVISALWPYIVPSDAATPAAPPVVVAEPSDQAEAGSAPAAVTPTVEPDIRLRGPINPAEWPHRVSLAAVDISADVVPVALEADGVMAVPPDGAEVGWYQRGAAPGTPGMAVLTAHVDTRRDGPGAFFRLGDSNVGDVIEVTLTDGTVQQWEVTRQSQQRKGDLPVADLYVRDGPPQLALVTCAGPFDTTARRYRDNLVVYAKLMDRP